jgi:hypothetical protein
LHNCTGEDACPERSDRNADAHLKRQIMGREVVVAITEGRLDFGPWEQIFYGEFDAGADRQGALRSCTPPVSSLGEPEGVKAAPEIPSSVSSTLGRIRTYDLWVLSLNPTA